MNPALVMVLAAGLLALQLPRTEQDDSSRFIVLKEFVSPVTGEPFFAPVLRDELTAASWDYDRCPHPPINTLAYSLIIDPASGYVAHPDEFNNPTDWDQADLEDILGQPRFSRLAPEGMPWAGAFPWEKFENAALLSAAAGEPAHFTGNWWLMAAWSVRLDVISGHNEFDAEVGELFARLPQRGPDASDLYTLFEIQLAEYWEELRGTGQLPDMPPGDFPLALAWLYRSRGELVAAERWLQTAALELPGLPDDSELYQYLESSIQLERSYLDSARRWLKQAWLENELPAQMESGTAYILGECNRRLGDLPAAVNWYDIARDKSLGMISSELINRQRGLSSGNRGY